MMTKVRLPLMIQDPLYAQNKGIAAFEGYDSERDFFLDGPVSKRVAVLDFDPLSGKLEHGVTYIPKPKRGWYEDDQGVNLRKYEVGDIYKYEFMQASIFAAVLKTLDLFEKTEAMGRELTWAFDAPQLLVIPRAGQMANAYYHRDTHSLQFFFFPSEEDKDKTIYSCLSRDIVAHETAHAIIDGIAPELVDSATPQSLALHEALADIVAVLMAFSSSKLRNDELRVAKDGSIKDLSQFSTIAEEFGQAFGHMDALRNMLNTKNLNPLDKENFVGRSEPHALSEVLSGALYSVMVNIHESLVEKYAQREKYKDRPNPKYSASGYALAKGAERFKRMVFRALDYLPPGCVSFLDFGRSMIAVDEVAFPDNEEMRNWIREAFEKRYIVEDPSALYLHRDFDPPGLEMFDPHTLYKSDWAAYEYVDQHRDLFGIPGEIPFQVLPRLKACKEYDYDNYRTECIFKVSWDQQEDNPKYPTIPKYRVITVGSTLVLDWETGEKLALLSNAKPPESGQDLGRGVDQTQEILSRRQSEYKRQLADRDEFILGLVEDGILKFGPQALGPDGKPLPSAVRAEVSEGMMRLKSTMNMLHITEVE